MSPVPGAGSRRRRDERGYTLVELIMVVGVLAVITPVAAQALILGFRTADHAHDRVTGSVALAALTSRITRDVAAATTVDGTTPAGCAAPDADPDSPTSTVAHLVVGDQDVSYVYDPATGSLDRVACTAAEPPADPVLTRTPLGSFGAGTFRVTARSAEPPVRLVCGTEDEPCASPCAVVLEVRVDDRSDPVQVVAVRRVDP